MELDIIADLIWSDAAWLAPFPVVFDVEYFVYPEAKHIGRGDVVFCDPEYTHFIVVELKRSERHMKKLLHQMYYYRDHLKHKKPHCLVDCAAVADGKLIRFATDDMQTGDGMYFSDSFKSKLRAGAYKGLGRVKPGMRRLKHRKCRSLPSSTSGVLCGRLRSARV